MLSILIPTYNYKCYNLVERLCGQLMASGVDYEIIVAEDGSKDRVSIIHNLRINDLPHCRHIIREVNVGRAAIKNFLVEEARGEWLLFLDSDAVVTRDDYIATLIGAIKTVDKESVICGGLYHADAMPDASVSLRWRYEHAADRHRSAMERQQIPYQHMTPFNMCVRREVMKAIPFDEHCRNYGYEDTLFGVTLQKKGIKVRHIDNPLLHAGLETNAVFLHKTEQSLQTLHSLGRQMMPHTRIGQVVSRLERGHVATPLRLMYRCLQAPMTHNLLSNRPSLKVFSAYKLGYLLSIRRKK